jgi:hypothetical protein
VELNRTLYGSHIAGKLNVLADRISRLVSIKDAFDVRLLLANVTSLSMPCKLNMSWASFHFLGRRVLTIPFVSCDSTVLCQVTTVIHYLGGSSLPKSDLCKRWASQCAHAYYICHLSKEALPCLGLQSSRYSGNSFRWGGYSLCYQSEFDLTSNKLCNNYETQAYEQYLYIPASTVLKSAVTLAEFSARV